MTLEDVIKAYERMKEEVDFVYANGIFPDEYEDDGFFKLIFHYKGFPKVPCYFEYVFDIDDDSWADEVEFNGNEIRFSVDSFKYIYSFITALSDFHQENKSNECQMLKFIDYLEKEREKENAEI